MEAKRNQLTKSVNLYGLKAKKTIIISKELDEMLNKKNSSQYPVIHSDEKNSPS
ncbi:MAG: aspartyl-phosphate phosphatase Spo0E family protein [bacterium]